MAGSKLKLNSFKNHALADLRTFSNSQWRALRRFIAQRFAKSISRRAHDADVDELTNRLLWSLWSASKAVVVESTSDAGLERYVNKSIKSRVAGFFGGTGWSRRRQDVDWAQRSDDRAASVRPAGLDWLHQVFGTMTAEEREMLLRDPEADAIFPEVGRDKNSSQRMYKRKSRAKLALGKKILRAADTQGIHIRAELRDILCGQKFASRKRATRSKPSQSSPASNAHRGDLR